MPGEVIALSISALNRKRAMMDEVMLAAEKSIATKPATREMLSKPGKERKVTDVLKTMVAFARKTSSGYKQPMMPCALYSLRDMCKPR
jgi:hypothetical protein